MWHFYVRIELLDLTENGVLVVVTEVVIGLLFVRSNVRLGTQTAGSDVPLASAPSLPWRGAGPMR